MANAVRRRPSGRPPAPESLVSYGLRLAPDKKKKLVEIKDFEGVSIREWAETHIERDYVRMLAQKSERAADERHALENGAPPPRPKPKPKTRKKTR